MNLSSHFRLACFCSLLSLVLPGLSFAQTGLPGGDSSQPLTPSTRQREVVRQVFVDGNRRVEPETVLSYLLIQPGDIYNPQRLDLSLKTLYATGLFSDVGFDFQNGILRVRVVENPIINRVIFHGNKALKEDKIRKELGISPRKVFTRARVQEDVERILQLYRALGRFSAVVSPNIVEQDQNRVDLIFDISEGPVTKVRSINFIGNKFFSDRRLRGELSTAQSRWWKFFASNDKYDPNRLEYDREKLREFYTQRGYADFRVVSAVAELVPDEKAFYITYTVDEGEVYTFNDINVSTTLDALNAEDLKALLPIKKGKRYNSKLIENSIDVLTFAAGAKGYAFVDVRPRFRYNREDHTIDINFEVNEGPRVYIERIEIVDNTRTLDHVIRREMAFVEGDAFNRILLERSRLNVRRLGFFKDVKIEELEGSRPDSAVVRVKVQEQPTGELSFGAGFSSTDKWLFEFSVSERNFRGRGQFLRLRASTSKRTQVVDIRFTEPRFLGRNLAAGFEVFHVNTDYIREAGFKTKRTGGRILFGFPLSKNIRMNVDYTLRREKVTASGARYDGRGRCPITDIICRQEGTRLYSILGYSLRWDRRNDPLRPTRGFDLGFSQDFAGLGGDVKFLRTELSGGVYYGIYRDDVIASFTGSAGYITSWGTTPKNIPINDRFFKGGDSFRGFKTAGLGPRIVLENSRGQQVPGDALGGKVYAIGTAEVSFPLGLPEEYGILGSVFTEFGTVGRLDPADKQANVRDDLSLRASVGFSVFWDSPFGPVRFDFSKVLKKEKYDETESFRFGARTRF